MKKSSLLGASRSGIRYFLTLNKDLQKHVIMETTKCPFCLEEINVGAIKCKHCRSTIVKVTPILNTPNQTIDGTLWLPMPSMIIGIICLLALLDDSGWDADTFVGLFAMATTSLVLGILSVNTQNTGRRMAITGIVLSSIALLVGIGLLIE